MSNSKVRKPNVVRGGTAIPLGRNYYYMSGRKHETGGIDIGKNPRTGLEVEDGEVMHVTKDEVKVFSAQPFLNGESPAQRVMQGDNPNTVFNAQERFKKRNKLNDDGTKKKRIGGQTPNRRYTTKLTDSEEKEFQTWYSKVSKYKNLNPNPDAAGQDYDYRGYWKNEDREGILGSNPNAHFTDRYKQPTHPTFSNESIYSNNETPGGSWVEGKGTWLFKHNKYTARQADRTADYLNGTGEGFILGTDTIIPNKRKRMGGTNRINKYKAGGLYSLTVDGITKLKMFPSTGELQRTDKMKFGGRRKATLGNDKKFKEGEDYEMVREEDFPIRNKREFYTPNKDAISLINKTNNYDPFMANSYFSLQRKISSLRNNKQTTINNIEDNTNNKASTNTSKSYTGNTKRSTKSTNKSKLIPTTSTTSVASTPPPSIVSPRVDLSSLAAPVPSLKYIDKTKLKSEVPARENLGRRAINYIKNNPNTIEDAIGLTSNIIGGLISHAANRKMLNNLKYSFAPTARTAAKLKTHININPQLDKMRESLAAYERDVDANTASSRVALARKQRARLASALNTNELYADKENKETELINKDRLNQQAVTAENIRDYNKWAENKAAFNRAVLEKKAENDVGLINTINAGVQNVLSNIGKRRSENKTIATMALANPDLPIELFYKEGIVNKRVRDAYRKAYPIKRKKKD